MSGVTKRNSSLAVKSQNRKVDMFYSVSETNEALELFKQELGPVGRALEGTPKYMNVSLYTKEDGKIWYGDIAVNEESKISTVARKISKIVYIIPEWSDKSPTNGKGWQDNALAIITP